MSAGKQQQMTAFWGMTINNYTETHLALLRQGYPDHLRQLVYTLEKGEDTGTPHVQAYLRLFRQQRLSYVKKLFPGANFKALSSDEYILNAQAYAQKLDSTAQSPASITNNQIPDPVSELLGVIRDVFETYADTNKAVDWRRINRSQMVQYKRAIECIRVVERPSLAKFYVSSVYEKVWSAFGAQLMEHVCAEQERAQKGTHTHTHTHGEKFSRRGGIINDATASEDSEAGEEDDAEGAEEDDDCEDYETGSGSGTDDTGSGSAGCSSDSQAYA